MASKTVIICVHGSGPKPPVHLLTDFWFQALKQGLERTMPSAVSALDACTVEMLHWAELAGVERADFHLELDLEERARSIEMLGMLKKSKDFRRRHYDALPGKSPLKEFAMDSAAMMGTTGMIWPRIMPELASYWQNVDGWADRVRAELGQKLADHVNADSRVMLISHCMGAVLTYDALCTTVLTRKVPKWLTLGAPLASNAVRKRLVGMHEDRYPESVHAWHNLAAEDDHVCHDKSVANDFNSMLERGLIHDISDHAIYNLATRDGRSSPRHSAGYLTHPRVAELVGNWLLSPTEAIEDQ